ncbi:hypothetical protein Taro_003755 [Colocasia esculenta]|uniref:Uncharacterized protein n=1 Tax=Colocasia esculenta TaxID=4460 RepID=A0A843TMJ7_COLES|nr:hypothetical protein [Colocasia esculenta]
MERGRRRAIASLGVLREVYIAVCALLSLVVRRLSRNASSVGYPRFCVSQARECARGLSRCSGTVEVLSSSWTPSLSGRVVVRLRERRQWDSDL